jgi:nucleotide-binding universal stress UspA family protein
MNYQRILFATDLSDVSFEAWPHALALAEKFGAELHAVLVLEEPYALAAYDQYAVLLDAIRDVKPQVERRLDERTKDHAASVRVRSRVLEAMSPVHALLDYVKNEKIDLVVMATHGRGGLGHLLLGSVVEKLIRLSPVPVVVVRPTKNPAAK